jgi:thiamine biosynthesis protein ThiS
MSTIEITANGEPRRVAAGTTLAELLSSLGLPPARVAVEHNGRIVPRDRLEEVALAPGDRLEVVTLVGGG